MNRVSTALPMSPFLLWALASALVGTAGAQTAPAVSGTPQQLLARRGESLSWNRNVSFNLATEITIDGAFNPASSAHSRNQVDYCREGNRLDLNIRWDHFDKAGNAIESLSRENHAIAGADRFFTYETNPGKPASSLAAERAKDKIVRNLLTYYVGPLEDYLVGNDLLTITEVLSGARELRCHEGTESVAGLECQVIESAGRFGKMTVWLAPSKQFSIVKLTLDKSTGDWIDALKLRPKGSKPGSGEDVVEWRAVFDSVEFARAGDHDIITAGRLAVTMKRGDGRAQTTTRIYKRSDINVNPDFTARGAFVLKVPDGIPVTDMDDQSGVSYEWKNGSIVAAVDPAADAKIAKVVTRAKAKKPVPVGASPLAKSTATEIRGSYWYPAAIAVGAALLGFVFWRLRRRQGDHG
jgi:hypothetical protein